MKYIIKISKKRENIIFEGYYASQRVWQAVSKNKADRLTQKEAFRIRNELRKLGFQAVVEIDK